MRPLGLLTLAACVVVGCSDGRHAERVLHDIEVPRLQAIIREDLNRARVGSRLASERIARGFVVTDAAQRQREMRVALEMLTRLPHGIDELTISPRSFIAVTDENGVVICRDQLPDPMAGEPAAERFPHIREALREGHETVGLVDWPGILPTDPSVAIVVHATPLWYGGRIAGALLVGTPLWRTAQRLTRQRQMEVPAGAIAWAYLARGDQLFHRNTPENLDAATPRGEDRAAGLAASPGGYTRESLQYGRWFAYGVVPTPELGPDVHLVAWYSDPVE